MTAVKAKKRSVSEFRSDVLSGFATGLFSIPEGMAYAQIAGVNPVYGLYSGMVATLTAALTTGTILMISTLTSAIAIATASVIDSAGLDFSDPRRWDQHGMPEPRRVEDKAVTQLRR
jgi:SulP family sulfate permease